MTFATLVRLRFGANAVMTRVYPVVSFPDEKTSRAQRRRFFQISRLYGSSELVAEGKLNQFLSIEDIGATAEL